MDLQIAKEVAIDFMHNYNLIEKGWTFEFHNAKRAYGSANISRKKIYLSTFLVPKMKYVDVKDTILHEVAHAIDGERRGYSNHDRTWKRIAQSIGADPMGSHNKAELLEEDYKYSFNCACGQSGGLHRKSQNSTYRCRACKATIVWKQNK